MWSHFTFLWCRFWKWNFRSVLCVLILLQQTYMQRTADHDCPVDCRQVLSDPNGTFTSPCYPNEYPKYTSCKWTLQAPVGFIIQITFLDFELEETPKCIFDNVTIHNGKDELTFCGLTLNKSTLNSTGNSMTVTFSTDFSIQKRGFNVSYRQVAVSLRNQKVTIPQNKIHVVSSASNVTIPALQRFTVCLEAKRAGLNNKDWKLFSYMDSSSTDLLSFGKSSSSFVLNVLGHDCDVSGAVTLYPDGELFSLEMTPFCLAWNGSLGELSVFTKSSQASCLCPNLTNKVIPGNGLFLLGSNSKNFESANLDVYNVRFWASAMSSQKLSSLTCDEKGSVIDWDNDYWSIHPNYLKTEVNLSCGTAVASPTDVVTTSCSLSGLGCPATKTSITTPVIFTTLPTNSLTENTQAIFSTKTSITTPVISTILPTNRPTESSQTVVSTKTSITTPVISTILPTNSLTESSQTVLPTKTSITTPIISTVLPTNSLTESSQTVVSTKTSITTPVISTILPTNSPTKSLQTVLSNNTSVTTPITSTTLLTNTITESTQNGFTLIPPTPSLVTTNMTDTNTSVDDGLYYRLSFVIYDNQHLANEQDVENAVGAWLNQTFENWTHTVYVANVSIQPKSAARSKRSTASYICNVLLIQIYKNDTVLLETTIQERIMNNKESLPQDLKVDQLHVIQVENCKKEEYPPSYKWPESRPTVVQYLPCFYNKSQNASRTCLLNLMNYTSFWGPMELSNCISGDIDSLSVSAENAAEIATQLKDITNTELTTDQVNKIVSKLKELISVAQINESLATTVVEVFSNVLSSPDEALAHSSDVALKTVDELAMKILFTGPSIAITSKNLALGISALNQSTFNGTAFSAGSPMRSDELQVNFERDQQNALAEVILPPSLLLNLNEGLLDTVSRIQFAFFTKTGLFQDQNKNKLSLVVATSVGNVSIKNLKDPVMIVIQHTQKQINSTFKPFCVFWDFKANDGSGGWSGDGCHVGPESNGNSTVCLCYHLTHFGVLMDISGAAPQIDARNTKILTFISYIGCGISAVFSAATLLTYLAFEKLRRDYPSKILMNLSTALLFLNMFFLLDGWLASFRIDGFCIAVAAFLHFFLLTSFTWMGLEAVHMYIALVKVFNTYIRRYILKFCIVGWGLPAITVTIVVAIDRNFYGKKFYGKDENTGEYSEFCWIENQIVFYITCVAYFGIVFLLNVAMFIVVMVQICGRNGKRTNRTMREEVLRNLRSVVSLTFLLGMTWGFAFFSWGPVHLAFTYLFAIFNSLQGLFIFVFHCALKENVQKQWRRYLCCGRFRLAENSDWSKTATNTKKVSSDNLGKSLSSSSFGSSSANWQAKSSFNPFARRKGKTGQGYVDQGKSKCGQLEADQTSIIPVHQVIDKVKGYCSVRSDNFYKNIFMSDSFSHSTKF
ncbi:adhesion G-protein coupled receptor G6 isoform X4 [Polypterus senegalus]|uniref:adhesion G-protein coupled receptor G6 isoform X4 n=1 Tax=Polypterus senegalus TaxID=55291 RepID=UPI001962B793|nr:adhesion G-protein coupled receptor G6 isoform X4 [Polypterus senegalus]